MSKYTSVFSMVALSLLTLASSLPAAEEDAVVNVPWRNGTGINTPPRSSAREAAARAAEARARAAEERARREREEAERQRRLIEESGANAAAAGRAQANAETAAAEAAARAQTNRAISNATVGYVAAIEAAGGNPDDYVMPADANTDGVGQAALAAENITKHVGRAETLASVKIDEIKNHRAMNYRDDRIRVSQDKIATFIKNKRAVPAERFTSMVRQEQIKIINIKLAEEGLTVAEEAKLREKLDFLRDNPGKIITTDALLYPRVEDASRSSPVVR